MNIPIYRANRKLVATKNGGLENPSPLVFNPSWNREVRRVQGKRFKYPSASGVKLPRDEEDIAFMSVSHRPFLFMVVISIDGSICLTRECIMAGS